MISNSTKRQIKETLTELLSGVTDKYDPDSPGHVLRDEAQLIKDGRLNPFHRALLEPGVINVSHFERSLSTTLGSMFEATAYFIGKEHFADARRQYVVRGHISNAARTSIDGILDEIRNDGFSDTYSNYVDNVVGSFHAEHIVLSVKADLYLRTANGEEIFFEMKAPKPNLDQCISVTRKLLEIHAMRQQGPPTVSTFYAMSYNPYGSREDYKWSIVRRHLDIEAQVLLGPEFWELIGGPGTYESVLAIFDEIGEENRDTIMRILG